MVVVKSQRNLFVVLVMVVMSVCCDHRQEEANARTATETEETSSTFLSDLSPTSTQSELSVETLDIKFTSTTVLPPLSDRLGRLNISGTKISDLNPLKGKHIRVLFMAVTPVTNLAPLVGLPLNFLDIAGVQVESIEPLRGMPLWGLRAERNSRLTDISALRGMRLTYLDLYCCDGVSNIEVLCGMPLTHLSLGLCFLVRDVGVLASLHSLEVLDLEGCWRVSDISEVKGRRLRKLDISYTQVQNIEVLRGMPLIRLNMHGATNITDVSVLRDMPLEELWITPSRVTNGIAEIRAIKTMKKINSTYVKDFWSRYDKGERRIGLSF